MPTINIGTYELTVPEPEYTALMAGDLPKLIENAAACFTPTDMISESYKWEPIFFYARGFVDGFRKRGEVAERKAEDPTKDPMAAHPDLTEEDKAEIVDAMQQAVAQAIIRVAVKQAEHGIAERRKRLADEEDAKHTPPLYLCYDPECPCMTGYG